MAFERVEREGKSEVVSVKIGELFVRVMFRGNVGKGKRLRRSVVFKHEG